MHEIALNIYDTQELFDKKTDIKSVIDNISLIKKHQQNMAESVAAVILAPIVCKYDISQIILDPQHVGDDDSFCGYMMNHIDGINGYDNYDEIMSADGKETITYSDLQEEISNALESMYYLLWEDAVIDVSKLRKEFLNSNLANELKDKKKTKSNKI